METFSTVCRPETYTILLIIAVNKGWLIYSYDVKNAFLHSEIDYEIYMKLPSYLYRDPKYKNKVAKLKKAIYGLKQAPLLWYKYLSGVLKNAGFIVCPYDEGVFIHPEFQITFICHVDDIIVLGPDKSEIDFIINKLSKHINLDFQGELTSFLGNDI